MQITAIQIAAGLSSRMKGPNKLLEDIGGKSLIQHTYTQLATSDIDQLIVVTGRDAHKVEASIINSELSPPKFIFNSNFAQGMTTSIQAGLQALDNADAIMICLSDMPLLRTEDYNVLISAFRNKATSKSILAPFQSGRRGNPVLFGSAYFADIAGHQEMQGCSELVKANLNHLIKVNVDNAHYFFGIGTPERLAEYKARVN